MENTDRIQMKFTRHQRDFILMTGTILRDGGGNRYINIPHYFMGTDDPYTFEVYMYDELPKGVQEMVDASTGNCLEE